MEFIASSSASSSEAEEGEATATVDDKKDIIDDEESSSSEEDLSDQESDSEGAAQSAIPLFPRTKNEILPHELQTNESDTNVKQQLAGITQAMAVVKIGKILNIVDRNLVVHHVEDTQPLDHGSILCAIRKDSKEKSPTGAEGTQARIPLGVIDEIFGPVNQPMYVVRAPTGATPSLDSVLENIDELKTQLDVYVVKQYAQQIDPRKLDTKGSDASNRYDEEVGEDEQDYSDDEKEAIAKGKKNKNRAKKGDVKGTGPGNRRRVKVRPNRRNFQHQGNTSHFRGYSFPANSVPQNSGRVMYPPPHTRHMMGAMPQQRQRPPLLGPPSAYMNYPPQHSNLANGVQGTPYGIPPQSQGMVQQQYYGPPPSMQPHQSYNPYMTWQPPPRPPPSS